MIRKELLEELLNIKDLDKAYYWCSAARVSQVKYRILQGFG